MVHDREGLPLGLKPCKNLSAIHPRFNNLKRDLAADRVLLLGHVHDAEAAFADVLQKLVTADSGANTFRAGRVVDRTRLLHQRDGLEHLPDSLGQSRMSVGILLSVWMLSAAKSRSEVIRQFCE
jgi:hypothetical protein